MFTQARLGVDRGTDAVQSGFCRESIFPDKGCMISGILCRSPRFGGYPLLVVVVERERDQSLDHA